MPPTSLTMTVTPEGASVARLLDAVEAWSSASGLGASATYRLGLVLEELATNVANHGAGGEGGARALSVAVERQGDAVTLLIEDDGRPFDPLSLPAPDTEAPIESRRIGGLGIHLSRRLSRSLSYAREDGRNRVTAILDAG